MKKSMFILAVMMLIGSGLLPSGLMAGEKPAEDQVKKQEPTKVYYFHLTKRCITCKTVEKVAKESLKELYPDQVKEGNLVFKSVNIDEKENKALTKKLKISGQTLLIVKGKERFDLTGKGFLYAVNEPDKLKAEMNTVLKKLMK